MEIAFELKRIFGNEVMLFVIGQDGTGRGKRFTDYSLNDKEQFAITDLYNRIDTISQNESLAKRDINSLLFKACNQLEGGRLVEKNVFDEARLLAGHKLYRATEEADKVLASLYKKLEINYSLLIIGSDTDVDYRHSFLLGRSLPLSPPQTVIDDNELSRLFDNDNDQNIGVVFEDGTNFGIQGCQFEDIIIRRSFANCCSRGTVTFKGVMGEIASLLAQIKCMARFKPALVSYFFGLRGIKLSGNKSLNGELYTLRKVQGGLMNHIKGEYRSELIVEIKVPVQRVNKDFVLGSISSGDNAYSSMKRLRLALVLAQNSCWGPSISYQEFGFSLNDLGYITFGRTPHKSLNFSEDHVEAVQVLFDKLDPNRTKKIKFALGRLDMALFSRWNAQDSILDGLIVWDCLFGSQGSSSFKICACVSRYLDKEDLVGYEHLYGSARTEFFDNLNKIYKNRNDLVHDGRLKTKLTNEDASLLREEILGVALACIKKMLVDDFLLAKDPVDRAKELITGSN